MIHLIRWSGSPFLLLNFQRLSNYRTLLYLQLIMQMQTQLTQADTKNSLLNDCIPLLSFVAQALDLERDDVVRKPHQSKGLTLDSLRIVPHDTDDERPTNDSDSDDEGEDDGHLGHGDQTGEMATTAVTLLLSVLEGKPGFDLIYSTL